MNWKRFKERFFADPTRVLALSGGGARGLAHIGVLSHLDRLSLKPELVTGTSMGAMIGGLYCLHGSSVGLKGVVKDILESDLFQKLDLEDLLEDEDKDQDSLDQFTRRTKNLLIVNKLMKRKSLVEPEFIEEVMFRFFGDATFADLKIPFVAVATDLYSGEDIALTEGRLGPAVQASAAIPGAFAPVPLNGMLLVDGYVTKNIPVPEPGEPPYRSDVIVVDVQPNLAAHGPWETGVDIRARTESIMQIQLNRWYLELADLVLVPKVQGVHWADFRRIDDLIEAGSVAALEKEEEIRRLFG